jgi:dienelactone hydrolase
MDVPYVQRPIAAYEEKRYHRFSGMRLAVCLSFIAFLSLHAQTLEVSPHRVMIDQPASIRATGCQPNERLTIQAELIDGADARWTSQAEFIADPQGIIDTSRQPAVAGSYKEVSSMGLIWSMKPSSSGTDRYQPPRDFGVQTIDFRLIRGGTRGSAQLAATSMEQVSLAEGVERVRLYDGSLRGTLFLPPGNTPHPGVLVLGGSEGGMPARRAAWFASHGYAALALAYFRFDDLPRELAGIPLEYFGQALSWMAHRPEIVSDRIAVTGVSRGGELALQLGSMYPAIKALVAYVPANVRYGACCGATYAPYAWTWQGVGLAFHSTRVVTAGPTESPMRTVIHAEQTRGPILLISGTDDRIWDSSSMADSVAARLKQFKFAYQVEHLKYPHAGHGAGRPEIVPAWQGWTRNPTSGREVEMGGTPKGNAESSLDAIPKVLDFLRQSLFAP